MNIIVTRRHGREKFLQALSEYEQEFRRRVISILVTELEQHEFRFPNERDLQDGIEQAISAAGLTYEREAVLDERSRVDFLLCPGVAVEVKVDGSSADVMRQLHRYALSPAVRAIVLVTTRQRHCSVPRELAGKPITIVVLTRSML